MSTPWLRWAGSKWRALPALRPVFENRTYDFYVDPFVGAGTVFFRLTRPVNSVLSDLNGDVISFYQFLKLDPDALWKQLSAFPHRVTRSYYYSIRKRYNTLPQGLDRAATFFFLNRTCFNGIYRINKRGEFNVPFGQRTFFKYPSLQTLRQVSGKLQRAEILHCDFADTLPYARRGALYYLDPPYSEIAGAPGYNRYAWPPFRTSDLTRLEEFILELVRRERT